MSQVEALIKINPEKVENLSQYISYCKCYFKPKSKNNIRDYKNLQDLKKDFPIVKEDITKNTKYKNNNTLKDFPLNWLKYEILNDSKVFEFKEDIQNIKNISGIYQNVSKLQEYVNNLPKYSFAIWFKFNLLAPYFSKDDDEFYIIQNPVLKERNFKVPMVRGSGWKGALAHAFRELFKDNAIEKVESFLRIFGAGSESIKALENYIFDKSKDLDKTKDQLLKFFLFELGLKVDKGLADEVKNIQNKDELLNLLKIKVSQKLQQNQKEFPLELQTHKGRAIFYPTYFDKLSLEIINPHDRRKRAGTKSIHYEVVPKDTEGIFQLIYFPFDRILKNDEELEKEVQEDLNNLCKAIEILADKGIGAKTKLGWGRFEISDKKVCLNTNLNICEGWEKCQD